MSCYEVGQQHHWERQRAAFSCGREYGVRSRTGRPGHTRTRRARRRWVLGSGEEERRISAPNSICWRTWPAPRQAENSTHVRTRTQCWLCPRRALPSCCAPRSAPASACASSPPQPPEPPTRAKCSLQHPYLTNQGQRTDARSFHLQPLSRRTPRSGRGFPAVLIWSGRGGARLTAGARLY